MMSNQLITCTKCGRSKLFTMFHLNKCRKKNGRASWCRECVQKYNREYYQRKKRLKAAYGVVATHQGKRYTAVYVAPHGFTPEATRQALEASQ